MHSSNYEECYRLGSHTSKDFISQNTWENVELLFQETNDLDWFRLVKLELPQFQPQGYYTTRTPLSFSGN